MPDLPPAFVHFLPGLIPAGALRGGVAVVVDVLRATTAMVHALNSGIECIIPCVEVDEARGIASSLGREAVILGGERFGLPIDGFDFGNSPSTYSPNACAGKTLVMTTTNGTKAILAGLDAERVFVSAFPNLQATVATLSRLEQPVHVVCAGTDGAVSLEDTLLAGALVESLRRSGRTCGNDAAQIATACWSWPGSKRQTVAERIAQGRGGRRVQEIGLAADIADAGSVDSFDFSAELDRRQEPFRIVKS